MARLRARMASSPADQKLHAQLAIALRALTEASGVCELAMHDRENNHLRRKASEARQILRHALHLLGGIGYLAPRYDTSDPDLASAQTKTASRERAK